jgi:hypothetical protein
LRILRGGLKEYVRREAEQRFGFLTGAGFRLRRSQVTPNGAKVVFISDSLAVDIAYEERDEALFIAVVRLIDGEEPDNRRYAKTHWEYLQALIERRNPSVCGRDVLPTRVTTGREAANVLAIAARELESLLPDALGAAGATRPDG